MYSNTWDTKQMSSEDQQQFAGITGVDLATAASYLEMAGGSLDTAVALFFDGICYCFAYLHQDLVGVGL